MAKKTLLLLRHAKSSWKSPDLADHERPLNGRGRDAAARMGQLLKEESLVPELVLCSSAVRTRETADIVFTDLQAPPPIQFRDDLYHADAARIGKILSQVGEPIRRVMLIGHNPGFEDFLGEQTGEVQPFPTAGLARIDYELDTWTQFNQITRGSLIRLWRPRDVEGD